MVVLPKLDYMIAKSELMESTWYEFASPAIDYVSEIWESYTILVEHISEKTKKTFPGLFGVLTRDAASVGKSGILATLGTTCKTHKLPGDQKLRPLHKSTRNPLNPGMKFLRHFMREFMHNTPHILKNSKHLKKNLDELIVLAKDLLVKIDVKDFFLSGKPGSLADICAVAFPAYIRRECKDLLLFLLQNQYVIDHESGAIRKVVKGSGMGLCFSGEIADLVFLRLSEMRFLDSSRSSGQIVFYSRFKDDLFSVFRGDKSQCLQWFHELEISCQSVFKLKLEEINESSVDFLDVTLFKGPRWRRSSHLDVRPFFKPSQRGAILSSCSSHPYSVHKSWPLCRFLDYEALSSSPHYAIAAKRVFLNKMRRQDPSHPALPVLLAALVPSCHSRTVSSQLGSWIVLPYHPALVPLQSVVHSIGKHWNHLATTYCRSSLSLYVPRISWSHGNKYLMQLLSK